MLESALELRFGLNRIAEPKIARGGLQKFFVLCAGIHTSRPPYRRQWELARGRATVALCFWGTADPQIMHSPRRGGKVMVLSYRKLASRSAFALVVGCLVWPVTGAPAAAQVSADQILNALAPPVTRGLTAPETKPVSEKDRAFIKSLRHRTRSLTFDEKERVAEMSKDWKKIDLEIYFEYNSARIAGEAEPQLDQLGEALRNPRLSNATVVVAGHTDAKGGEKYNEGLSDRRADAVK